MDWAAQEKKKKCVERGFQRKLDPLSEQFWDKCNYFSFLRFKDTFSSIPRNNHPWAWKQVNVKSLWLAAILHHAWPRCTGWVTVWKNYVCKGPQKKSFVFFLRGGGTAETRLIHSLRDILKFGKLSKQSTGGTFTVAVRASVEHVHLFQKSVSAQAVQAFWKVFALKQRKGLTFMVSHSIKYDNYHNGALLMNNS